MINYSRADMKFIVINTRGRGMREGGLSKDLLVHDNNDEHDKYRDNSSSNKSLLVHPVD